MAKSHLSRRLIAGALALVALAPCAPAFAQRDDGDDKEIPEEPISADRGFRMLGKGREGAAWTALEGQDRTELVKKAVETVRTSTDRDEVVGAAVFLGDPKVRANVSGDEVEQVRERLEQAGETSPELRGALIEALGAVGKPKDLSELKRMVRKGSEEDAALAARALCRSNDGDALGSLLFSADSIDDPKRLAAVQEALTWMAKSERGDELAEAMGSNASPALLEALTHVRSAKGAAAVREIARDRVESDDPQVRAVALRLLISSRDTASTELVVAALGDEDPNVRAMAATAARKLTVEEAVPKLIELLSDERGTQDAAHAALVSLTGVQLPRDRRSWQMWLDKQKKKKAAERATAADERLTARKRDQEAQAEHAASSQEPIDPTYVAGGAGAVLLVLLVLAIRVMSEKPKPVKLVEVPQADPKSRTRRKQRKGTSAWTKRFHAKELRESIAEAKADSEIEELIKPTDTWTGKKRASAWTERLKRMVDGEEGIKVHGPVDESDASIEPTPEETKRKKKLSTSSSQLRALLSDEWGREE